MSMMGQLITAQSGKQLKQLLVLLLASQVNLSPASIGGHNVMK